MREILFRGKRIDNGKWVYGDLVNCSAYRLIYELRHGDEPREYCEVIPETVGQYTGLKDKNGKRIFEGDIVKAADTNDADLVGEVVFNACAWLVSGANWLDSLFRANEVHILEVIGNIHDNPELLEVEG